MLFRSKWEGAISDAGTSLFQFFYSEPVPYPALTDIEITAEATASGVTGAAVSASFNVILVDD